MSNLQDAHPQEQSESVLVQTRKDKLERLRQSGTNPYPATSFITAGRLTTNQIKSKFETGASHEESAEICRLCARLVTRRDMGKASFAHLQDFDGRLQIYVRQETVGKETYEKFCKEMDLGDILGVEGKIFRTKTGELTLKAETIILLSKSLRPLPEKWHGLKDIEIRSRLRELDLITNAESRKVFEMRAKIIQSLRSTLHQKGYLEVETPMMQSVPGGAVARPFETYHNALEQKFFLRVAPELYLKRCLVGGFEKVFEIGRVFRNEGMDSLHNPEFTILEAYESYGNMNSMMLLSEDLIGEIVRNLFPSLSDSFSTPFKRHTIEELFKIHVSPESAEWISKQDWDSLSRKHESYAGEPAHKVFDHLFTEKVAPHLQSPTFVTEFPADFSPLAKLKEGFPQIAERFELYVAGEEIANAYSELNDPTEQKKRLENYRQSRIQSQKEEKDDETEGMGLDESFLTALEYGMPPAGGLGIGVDRLVMLLTEKKSVRDVLLFPTLRPEK
ncbi:MAG: lysine--tRNA ligase [Elusimicrobia bacterium]|nr:lysine--tRNA ligase [Elusimicrobiota bacterium]